MGETREALLGEKYPVSRVKPGKKKKSTDILNNPETQLWRRKPRGRKRPGFTEEGSQESLLVV